jgi:hypothetical protein
LGLSVVVQLFLVMMAVAEAKEPPIAGRAAIRVLKQHIPMEPIFDAASSRTEKLFATAMGTLSDWSLRSGFVHGKILYRRIPMLQHLAALIRYLYVSESRREILSTDKAQTSGRGV